MIVGSSERGRVGVSRIRIMRVAEASRDEIAVVSVDVSVWSDGSVRLVWFLGCVWVCGCAEILESVPS